jgi:hypothetical protein
MCRIHLKNDILLVFQIQTDESLIWFRVQQRKSINGVIQQLHDVLICDKLNVNEHLVKIRIAVRKESVQLKVNSDFRVCLCKCNYKLGNE